MQEREKLCSCCKRPSLNDALHSPTTSCCSNTQDKPFGIRRLIDDYEIPHILMMHIRVDALILLSI